MKIRWLGTALCLAGMALTAVRLYPFNLVLSAAGSAIWCLYGVKIRDVAMWVVELAAVLIGIAGLALYLVR